MYIMSILIGINGYAGGGELLERDGELKIHKNSAAPEQSVLPRQHFYLEILAPYSFSQSFISSRIRPS